MMIRKNKSTFYVDDEFPQYILEENNDGISPPRVFKQIKSRLQKQSGIYYFEIRDDLGVSRIISEARIEAAIANKKPIKQQRYKSSKCTKRASNRTYILQLMEEKQLLQEQYPRLQPYLDEAILFLEKRPRSRYANLRYLIIQAAISAKIKTQKQRITINDDTNAKMG